MKLLFLISMFFSVSVYGQKIFTETELIAVVRQFHPVARQAMLEVRIAEADLTASRGAFDPVISFSNSRKDFDGTNYYNQQWSALTIPTWYGIDLYGGSETLRGDRINPEETKGTISYLGLSAPLLQNVLIDKRRAAVQQAKILSAQSIIVRRAALNDIIAEALDAYWDWWEQYRQLQVIRASLNNAKTRFVMVKTMYQLGDRPAIDTLEAMTQIQLFEQLETETDMLLQKSRMQLSLYLWKENNLTYALPPEAIPAVPGETNPPILESLLAEAKLHPLLLEYDYRLQGLGIEKRLKFQSLLPEVTARYNVIARDFSKAFNAAYFDNNFRFGLALSMPLRLSEGRGTYQSARLKIEQTRVAQVAKQVSILNKVNQYYIEWLQTTRQHQQQQSLLLNYFALQKGEEIKFANGESSLFLINAREARTIEGQRKELTLAAKIQQAGVRLRWAAGSFSNL
jgi:outer membrane protein TolC